MWSIVIFLFSIFTLPIQVYQTCDIKFDRLDAMNITRYIYEEDIFNITGELQHCPSSLIIRNISIANPYLRRLSILNVSFFIETNRIHLTGLARLVGFAPITLELYFKHQDTSNRRYFNNCALKSTEQCSTLKYRHGFYVLTEKITVAVKRRQTVIDTLFTVVVLFLVTFGTLCIGCDLEYEQLINNFRRPIPLLIGLGCQIIYLPLLAKGLTKMFQLNKSTSLGLLSTAGSPGGGSSNIYTALLYGDVDLSVIMTFISTVLAFGTFPFWVWSLGHDYIDFDKIKFPWWNMFLSLMTLFLPAMVGVLLRRYRPVLAFRIGRYLNPIAVGYLVFILTFGVYINMYIFYIINWKEIFVCCFLPWFGFIGGAIISLVILRDRKKIIAICIETGIQNTAVAIFFLRLTFPQPESDIALANPILVSMAIPIPFLLLVLTRAILKRFNLLDKCFPKTNQKTTNEIISDKPEKLVIKELLEEQEQQECLTSDKNSV